MTKRDVDLEFMSDSGLSHAMHDAMEETAVRYLNSLIEQMRGTSPKILLFYYSGCVAVTSLMYFRMGVIEKVELQKFHEEEASVLILQIMGLGREKDITLREMDKQFDAYKSVFLGLVNSILPYLEAAMDRMDGLAELGSVARELHESPVYSDEALGHVQVIGPNGFRAVHAVALGEVAIASIRQLERVLSE